MFKMINRTIAITLVLALVLEQSGFAQVAPQMPVPAYINGYVAPDRFRPVQLRSLRFDEVKHDFNLVLDKGDARKLKPKEVKLATDELMKFFTIGLALPNTSFWVNLRPDNADQVIDPYLAQTDAGRILLAADLQLKKDMARFTSPKTSEGRNYWNKLYGKAEELFGAQQVSIPTITRPWIVPGEILVRENQTSAYIFKASLKVMLEQDWIAGTQYQFDDPRLKQLNEYSSAIIREEILPKLTREVNSSRKYAGLRQVYYALILAQWFKQRYGARPGGAQTQLEGAQGYISRIDSRNLEGVISHKAWSKEQYYRDYKKSFEQGEYNLSETVSTGRGMVVRQYFSGGVSLRAGQNALPGIGQANPASASAGEVEILKDNLMEVSRDGSVLKEVTGEEETPDGGKEKPTMDDLKAQAKTLSRLYYLYPLIYFVLPVALVVSMLAVPSLATTKIFTDFITASILGLYPGMFYLISSILHAPDLVGGLNAYTDTAGDSYSRSRGKSNFYWAKNWMMAIGMIIGGLFIAIGGIFGGLFTHSLEIGLAATAFFAWLPAIFTYQMAKTNATAEQVLNSEASDGGTIRQRMRDRVRRVFEAADKEFAQEYNNLHNREKYFYMSLSDEYRDKIERLLIGELVTMGIIIPEALDLYKELLADPGTNKRDRAALTKVVDLLTPRVYGKVDFSKKEISREMADHLGMVRDYGIPVTVIFKNGKRQEVFLYNSHYDHGPEWLSNGKFYVKYAGDEHDRMMLLYWRGKPFKGETDAIGGVVGMEIPARDADNDGGTIKDRIDIIFDAAEEELDREFGTLHFSDREMYKSMRKHYSEGKELTVIHRLIDLALYKPAAVEEYERMLKKGGMSQRQQFVLQQAVELLRPRSYSVQDLLNKVDTFAEKDLVAEDIGLVSRYGIPVTVVFKNGQRKEVILSNRTSYTNNGFFGKYAGEEQPRSHIFYLAGHERKSTGAVGGIVGMEIPARETDNDGGQLASEVSLYDRWAMALWDWGLAKVRGGEQSGAREYLQLQQVAAQIKMQPAFKRTAITPYLELMPERLYISGSQTDEDGLPVIHRGRDILAVEVEPQDVAQRSSEIYAMELRDAIEVLRTMGEVEPPARGDGPGSFRGMDGGLMVKDGLTIRQRIKIFFAAEAITYGKTWNEVVNENWSPREQMKLYSILYAFLDSKSIYDNVFKAITGIDRKANALAPFLMVHVDHAQYREPVKSDEYRSMLTMGTLTGESDPMIGARGIALMLKTAEDASADDAAGNDGGDDATQAQEIKLAEVDSREDAIRAADVLRGLAIRAKKFENSSEGNSAEGKALDELYKAVRADLLVVPFRKHGTIVWYRDNGKKTLIISSLNKVKQTKITETDKVQREYVVPFQISYTGDWKIYLEEGSDNLILISPAGTFKISSPTSKYRVTVKFLAPPEEKSDEQSAEVNDGGSLQDRIDSAFEAAERDVRERYDHLHFGDKWDFIDRTDSYDAETFRTLIHRLVELAMFRPAAVKIYETMAENPELEKRQRSSLTAVIKLMSPRTYTKRALLKKSDWDKISLDFKSVALYGVPVTVVLNNGQRMEVILANDEYSSGSRYISDGYIRGRLTGESYRSYARSFYWAGKVNRTKDVVTGVTRIEIPASMTDAVDPQAVDGGTLKASSITITSETRKRWNALTDELERLFILLQSNASRESDVVGQIDQAAQGARNYLTAKKYTDQELSEYVAFAQKRQDRAKYSIPGLIGLGVLGSAGFVMFIAHPLGLVAAVGAVTAFGLAAYVRWQKEVLGHARSIGTLILNKGGINPDPAWRDYSNDAFSQAMVISAVKGIKRAMDEAGVKDIVELAEKFAREKDGRIVDEADERTSDGGNRRVYAQMKAIMSVYNFDEGYYDRHKLKEPSREAYYADILRRDREKMEREFRFLVNKLKQEPGAIERYAGFLRTREMLWSGFAAAPVIASGGLIGAVLVGMISPIMGVLGVVLGLCVAGIVYLGGYLTVERVNDQFKKTRAEVEGEVQDGGKEETLKKIQENKLIEEQFTGIDAKADKYPAHEVYKTVFDMQRKGLNSARSLTALRALFAEARKKSMLALGMYTTIAGAGAFLLLTATTIGSLITGVPLVLVGAYSLFTGAKRYLALDAFVREIGTNLFLDQTLDRNSRPVNEVIKELRSIPEKDLDIVTVNEVLFRNQMDNLPDVELLEYIMGKRIFPATSIYGFGFVAIPALIIMQFLGVATAVYFGVFAGIVGVFLAGRYVNHKINQKLPDIMSMLKRDYSIGSFQADEEEKEDRLTLEQPGAILNRASFLLPVEFMSPLLYTNKVNVIDELESILAKNGIKDPVISVKKAKEYAGKDQTIDWSKLKKGDNIFINVYTDEAVNRDTRQEIRFALLHELENLGVLTMNGYSWMQAEVNGGEVYDTAAIVDRDGKDIGLWLVIVGKDGLDPNGQYKGNERVIPAADDVFLVGSLDGGKNYARWQQILLKEKERLADMEVQRMRGGVRDAGLARRMKLSKAKIKSLEHKLFQRQNVLEEFAAGQSALDGLAVAEIPGDGGARAKEIKDAYTLAMQTRNQREYDRLSFSLIELVKKDVREYARDKRILVVDDEKAMRELVSIMYRSLGFSDIETAGNPVEALEKYREAIAQGRAFDLVSTDHSMPFSAEHLEKDGLWLADQIQQVNKGQGIDIPIIWTSGADPEESGAEAAKSRGMIAAIVSKPRMEITIPMVVRDLAEAAGFVFEEEMSTGEKIVSGIKTAFAAGADRLTGEARRLSHSGATVPVTLDKAIAAVEQSRKTTSYMYRPLVETVLVPLVAEKIGEQIRDKKVLVVIDEIDWQIGIEQLLAGIGVKPENIFVAGDAYTAFGLYQAVTQERGGIDIVISDNDFPMGGTWKQFERFGLDRNEAEFTRAMREDEFWEKFDELMPKLIKENGSWFVRQLDKLDRANGRERRPLKFMVAAGPDEAEVQEAKTSGLVDDVVSMAGYELDLCKVLAAVDWKRQVATTESTDGGKKESSYAVFKSVFEGLKGLKQSAGVLKKNGRLILQLAGAGLGPNDINEIVVAVEAMHPEEGAQMREAVIKLLPVMRRNGINAVMTNNILESIFRGTLERSFSVREAEAFSAELVQLIPLMTEAGFKPGMAYPLSLNIDANIFRLSGTRRRAETARMMVAVFSAAKNHPEVNLASEAMSTVVYEALCNDFNADVVNQQLVGDSGKERFFAIAAFEQALNKREENHLGKLIKVEGGLQAANELMLQGKAAGIEEYSIYKMIAPLAYYGRRSEFVMRELAGLSWNQPFFPMLVALIDSGKSREEILDEYVRLAVEKALLNGGLPVENAQAPADLGGIDMRALPVQSLPAVAPIDAAAAGALAGLSLAELDQRWADIRKTMAKGEMPCREMKELLVACAGRQDALKQKKQVVDCVSAILEMEEERAISTPSDLKELIALL